jgi:hypothetical protein
MGLKDGDHSTILQFAWSELRKPRRMLIRLVDIPWLSCESSAF